MKDFRTVDDLSEQEYEDYQIHPEAWEDVTYNTCQSSLEKMFPNGADED